MQKQNVFASIVLVLALGVVAAAQGQNFTPVHEFNGANDGRNPEAAPVLDAAGNLYGTTFTGGANGQGTIYKIDATGKESTLFAFTDVNVTGGFPQSSLILDQEGNLYGTGEGGPGGAGVVFKISPQGKETILFAFQGCLSCHNPRVPTGALLLDKAGNLFGATIFGGSGNCQSGCGVIFRLDTAGNLHILHSFNGVDGTSPLGSLVPDASGNLYGVAQFGGDPACSELEQSGCGTVFQLARNGKLTVLHTFSGADGATPQPGLLLDSVGGNLFGAASHGGNAEHGVIFRISSSGRFSIVHRFAGATDGASPNGNLVIDSAGNLFGTAQTAGPDVDGTAFTINPAGQLKLLHAFNGDLDGSFPIGGLIRDDLGHLFGTAVSNGLINQQNGDVFEIRP